MDFRVQGTSSTIHAITKKLGKKHLSYEWEEIRNIIVGCLASSRVSVDLSGSLWRYGADRETSQACV